MEQAWQWSGWLAPKYFAWLLSGLAMTLAMAAQASILATGLGLLVAGARTAPSRLLSALAWLYISVFRNTPLLVQLFFWYFGVPNMLPDGVTEWLNARHVCVLPGGYAFDLPAFEFMVGLFGLSLYATAFIAEEFRAGMRAVGLSQRQAAQALGMNGWQIFRHIIMPQAARHALPPLLGQYMNIVKSSSLTMAIGVMELSYASRQVETETFKTFQAFGVATLGYILVIALIEVCGQYIQQQRSFTAGRR